MQLKSLLISGFKSFHEARLDFPSGIIAIVGPNGAGKSNVVDAILWVLGEQSTKALRSERMEDVIFNGSESRKPLSMAEVSLVVTDVTSQELESVAGVLDELPGNRELMVTRRLYRDGESEYFINKIPCRLKDIRLLFLEARAGTKGHTVIEQGNIDQLLSGSSQDRRNFIEETAGIGRFKKQKTEALRKLHATQQNLLRVRDIIGEVQKQLKTLERQARQAEQFGKLQDECRSLEIKILSTDYQKLRREQQDLEGQIAAYETQEAEQMAEEAKIAASHEALREEQLQIGEMIGRTQEDLRKLEQEMGQTLTRLEVERNRIQLYREQQTQGSEEQSRLQRESKDAEGLIATMQSRVAQAMEEAQEFKHAVVQLESKEQTLLSERSSVQTQLEALRQRMMQGTVEQTQTETSLQNGQGRKDDLLQQIHELEEDLREGESRRLEIAERLAQLRQTLQGEQEKLEAVRSERQDQRTHLAQLVQHIQMVEHQRLEGKTKKAAAESRLLALQAVLKEEFGYDLGEEGESGALRQACQGIKEALGERLEVPQYLEAALEAVLGEYLRTWIVENDEAIVPALQFMKDRGQGRGTFIPIQPYDLVGEEPPYWWPEVKQHEGVIGRAVELVSIPQELQPILKCLLHRVVVIQHLDQAMSFVRQRRCLGPASPLFVTLAGEIIQTSGLVSGGSSGDATGVLQRRREVRSLEEEMVKLVQELERLDSQYSDLRHQHDSTEFALKALDDSLKEVEQRALLTENHIANAAQHLSDAEDHVQSVRQELTESQAEIQQLDEENQARQARLIQLQHELASQETERGHLTSRLQALETELTTLYEQLTEARLAMMTLKERQERAEADLLRLKEEEEARHTRRRLLADQLEALVGKEQESRAELTTAEIRFKELEQQKEEQQAQLQTLEECHHDGMARVRELEQRLSEIRKHYTALKDHHAEAEVQLAQVQTRLEAVMETLTGTYGQALDELPAIVSDNLEAESREVPEEWRERVRILRMKLERLGPLNLAAIEEHRELEERYQFLTKQESDLTDSIHSLREIIHRLNHTTNQMFEETFAALQEKFGEVFSALFAGGHAELVLSHSDSDEEVEDRHGEPGVDIIAQPPGKRLKNLSMLSGGEKALTVLALLFASFLIKPSPFCILDEVDAPLDDPNVIRFARFLSQLTDLSQFLVITHNKRTMEVADSLFGVTMEEPGVSKFVSVRLAELQKA